MQSFYADFPTGLKDCLFSQSYSLPNFKEAFAKLNEEKFFSKVNLSEAHLQIH